MSIIELLEKTVQVDGSDLHLSAGLPPAIRVHGSINYLDMPALEHDQVEKFIYDIMSEKRRKVFEENLEVDFAISIKDLGRFRANCFHQNRGAAAVFRQIPSRIPTLQEIDSPPIFNDILRMVRGLVLVTGPTGSGKSTTLATLINQINASRKAHIITIEDPIEFIHRSQSCLVNQREVSKDTHSFSNALRSALREDPDVILVGEMRDLETIRLAITAAETGHLVFGTLHTVSSTKTIDRIIDVFPAEEKEMIKSALSESLQAVISQILLKKKTGLEGRVAAREILLCTPAIRTLIRDHKLSQMYSIMQVNTRIGMKTLDQDLKRLVDKGEISYATAVQYAVHKDTLPKAQTVS